MKFVIVSGLSGAGKTIALHSLEDLGAYCIDNLPVNVLPIITKQLMQSADNYSCIAIGVDARNMALQNIPLLLETLKAQQLTFQILFVEASDEVLLKRFSETRRRHPLTSQTVSLVEALQKERHLLAPLSDEAEIRIDTSDLNIYQLRDLVRLRTGLQLTQQMPLLLQSFGFKRGKPADADFVFDARCLPNPYWEVPLRGLTGRDELVQTFLASHSQVNDYIEDLSVLLKKWLPLFEAENRSYLSVAIGCTGGQHRSVYVVERLAEFFRTVRENVLVRHREQA
ncbi:MAG: RNase adapter RapZ [Pseudomonadota bacterium]|jgi:UPF0042 nucleotide-binding protein